jgi:small-conductance mechanosensitive channel
MDALARLLQEIRGAVSWAPDWAVALALAMLAGLLALCVYLVVERIVYRVARRRKGFWVSFIPRTRVLLRSAVVIAAVNVVTHSGLFPRQLGETAGSVLWVCVVLLLGWAAIIALDVAAAYHLRHFRVDVADNLVARKHLTQVRIIKRVLNVLVALISVAAALMTFDSVRQFGVSLFASAGAAGLIVGLAARPVLSNLIAGLQLAITQPIRLGDEVTVEGEFGTVEDIGSAFIVIRIWDMRRLVVPLSYFIEQPVQNYTRTSSQGIGTVMFRLDFSIAVDDFRSTAERIVKSSSLWDKQSLSVLVTDVKDNVVELRVAFSAQNSGDLWDLRCYVREKLLQFLQTHRPESFPRHRYQSYVTTPMAAQMDDGQPSAPVTESA